MRDAPKLIDEIVVVQKNTVVVLTNGSAVTMPWMNDVSGVLETWLGGQAGAGGIADVEGHGGGCVPVGHLHGLRAISQLLAFGI